MAHSEKPRRAIARRDRVSSTPGTPVTPHSPPPRAPRIPRRPPVNVELRQLRHFLAAIDHGSILAAASACAISQSGLTRSIQGLENAVGVSLLVRGPRGVLATPYGEAFARHARLILNQGTVAVGELRALAEGRGGHLRIGVGPGLSSILAPGAIARALEKTDGLRISLVEGTFEPLLSRLQTAQIDAAICAVPPGSVPAGIRHDPLLSTPLVVAARASHPLAALRDVSAADLAVQRWAVTTRPFALGEAFARAFHRYGLAAPLPVLEVESMAILPTLLAASAFVALVAKPLLLEVLARREVAILRQRVFTGLTADIGLLRRTDAPPAPGMTALLAELSVEFVRVE